MFGPLWLARKRSLRHTQVALAWVQSLSYGSGNADEILFPRSNMHCNSR